MELYAEAFESVNQLDKLEGFTSIYGAQFYGLSPNTKHVRLVKQPWTVPESYAFGDSEVKPLRAGEVINWKVLNENDN